MKNKPKMPVGIVIWFVMTVLALISILVPFGDYIKYPLGATLIIIALTLILSCIGLTIARAGRLIVGISHLVVAAVLGGYLLFFYIAGAQCMASSSCDKSGVIGIPIMTLLLSGPIAYFLCYGLYFTLSKKVKAYFGNK